MKLPIYYIDAFTDRLFSGNSAAVVLLDKWLKDRDLSAIATENNLPATAFVVPHHSFRENKPVYELRCFYPSYEALLCGHATLASAHTLFTYKHHQTQEILFHTQSGILSVTKDVENNYTLELPSYGFKEKTLPDNIQQRLKYTPIKTLFSNNTWIAVLHEHQVRDFSSHFLDTDKDTSGIILTSKSDGSPYDIVSRYFGFKGSRKEDSATGSAHCCLVPYWSEALKKCSIHAYQASSRGGVMECEQKDHTVLLTGQAVSYLQGFISL